MGKQTARKRKPRNVGNKGLKKGGPIGDEADRASVKQRFLEEFVVRGIVSHACAAVGIGRATHYHWLEADPEYASNFAAAEEDVADALEAEARRRAIDGVVEPVGFYLGRSTTFVTRYSDPLLKVLLEGRRANIFKNRHEHTGADGGPITVTKIENVIVDPAAPDEDES
jgi:hypothetical protein